jgi:hypothetical protein
MGSNSDGKVVGTRTRSCSIRKAMVYSHLGSAGGSKRAKGHPIMWQQNYLLGEIFGLPILYCGIPDISTIQPCALLVFIAHNETSGLSRMRSALLMGCQLCPSTRYYWPPHSNDCSDPRDKVFAVLGLATDWLEKGGLDPDYRETTTAEEIYKRYAMWDVKKNRSLRILSFASGRPESFRLPSWAPDWRFIDNHDLLTTTYDED